MYSTLIMTTVHMYCENNVSGMCLTYSTVVSKLFSYIAHQFQTLVTEVDSTANLMAQKPSCSLLVGVSSCCSVKYVNPYTCP